MTSRRLDALELKLPPLALLALLACVMPLGRWIDGAPWTLPRNAGGADLAVSGLALMVAGAWTFRRARTTVNPLRPETASRMVRHGPFRVTRNPMYLGMAVMLAGWAFALGSAWAAMGVPVFVAWMNRFQIAPEERALRARFGADFEAYAAEVRRWL